MTIGEEGMGNRTLIGIPITIVIGIIPGIVVALLCRKYRNKPKTTTAYFFGRPINNDTDKKSNNYLDKVYKFLKEEVYAPEKKTPTSKESTPTPPPSPNLSPSRSSINDASIGEVGISLGIIIGVGCIILVIIIAWYFF